MTNQVIPVEAVEAAAEYLPHAGDCQVRPERDCTCWQPRVNLMRAALEAAAPRMLAVAWDQGWYAADLDSETNPYRSAK